MDGARWGRASAVLGGRCSYDRGRRTSVRARSTSDLSKASSTGGGVGGSEEGRIWRCRADDDASVINDSSRSSTAVKAAMSPAVGCAKGWFKRSATRRRSRNTRRSWANPRGAREGTGGFTRTMRFTGVASRRVGDGRDGANRSEEGVTRAATRGAVRAAMSRGSVECRDM